MGVEREGYKISVAHLFAPVSWPEQMQGVFVGMNCPHSLDRLQNAACRNDITMILF